MKQMQNRVNPFGQIIDTKARGSWMGNRGRIHNEKKEIVCPYKLQAWLTCKLSFNGRKRQIMAPNSYTELFFLDEATAFAAGHRPCFECRREDFNRFKNLWIKANLQYKFSDKTSIREIDKILHAERINTDGTKKMYREHLNNLPDGTFISLEEKPYLLFKKHLYWWTPYGYEKQNAITIKGKVNVLTPLSIVNTFHAGYIPQMSPGIA
ncbi:MAG TPA: hypothetical protein VN726_13095 [Hanamia sp.]|nr:hypothetical protein [Hanamia sp.]